ncbi:MAG: CPCC family cysteine-rich protein [Butyricicoccaceae bacterium]
MPEAFFGGVQEQEDEEELDRTSGRMPYPGRTSRTALTGCRKRRPSRVVLRRRDPRESFVGYICPMCGWEIDYDVEGEPDKPSDQNHGLSLTEARWNFHSFGTVAPWKVMENGE